MARGALTFRESDLTRALKAAAKAGVALARVEICKDGRIVLLPGKAQDAPPGDEWDEALRT
jgi:hypothetical protein